VPGTITRKRRAVAVGFLHDTPDRAQCINDGGAGRIGDELANVQEHRCHLDASTTQARTAARLQTCHRGL